MKLKWYHVFLNWAATVVVGSIVWSTVIENKRDPIFSLFSESLYEGNYFIYLSVLAVYVVLYSMPAICTMICLNFLLTTRQKLPQFYKLYIILAYPVSMILNFTIYMTLMGDMTIGRELIVSFIVFSLVGTLGFLVLFKVLDKKKRKSVVKK